MLLCKLRSDIKLLKGLFIEKLGAFSQPVVAELLCYLLRVRTLRPLFDEVVQEANDLVVKSLERLIGSVVQLLSD